VPSSTATPDDTISPELPKRVAAELPNGTAHVWPGAGHCGFVDRERWTELLSAAAWPRLNSVFYSGPRSSILPPVPKRTKLALPMTTTSAG
jgi:hypothetical protein